MPDDLFTNPLVGVPNQNQVDTVNKNLGWGGLALAGGAAARGLTGLGQFFGRETGGEPKTPMRQSFVRIPVPVKVKTRAERDAMLAQAQEEIDKEAAFAKLAEDSFGATIAHLGGLLREPHEQVGLLRKTLSGWGEPGMAQKPWTYIAAPLAIGGGLYGGWKLTDYLLNKTRSAEQESELESARKEYESALAGRRKLASAEPDPLDDLAAEYEKRALVNELAGIGLGAAGLTALLSGLGTYRWTRSLAEDKAVEEAVRRRQAQLAEQSPSPIMAVPTPVPIYEPRKPAWHRLLGHGDDTDKGLAGEGDRPMRFGEHKAAMAKEAAEVVHGGPISSWTGATLGRAGATLAGLPVLTMDTLRSPEYPERFKEHEKLVKQFEKVRPQQLSDVKVRLGGTDTIDDIIRTWQNRRTGPIGKVLGTLGAPMGNLRSTLMRSPHYNPYSNAVVQFAHSKPITQHELGHAIDFNQVEPSKNFWQRQLQGTGRDLYGLAYSAIPFANLWHEAQANNQSRLALEDIYKKNPAKLRAEEVERLKVLPAGYGSYVGGNLLGAPGATIGSLAGKGLGMGLSAIHAAGKDEPVKKPKKSEPDHKKAASINQAADDFLGRMRSNQMAVWNRLMTPTDGKPAKPAKPAEPLPPRLPTLAGLGGGTAQHLPVTDAR